MNVIYCCCISDVWIKTAHLLKDNLNINPKYFVGWKNDIDQKIISNNFDDCYLQYVEDLWRGLGFPEYIKNKNVLDEETFSAYAFEISNAIKMIDRLDPYGDKFSYSERLYWVIGLIESWITIIRNKEIKLVISPSIPHRVFDYALYIASLIEGVEFIMFQMTPFSDKSFIINDVNETPNYLKSEIRNEKTNLSLLPNDIKERISSLDKDYESATPDYMIEQKRTNKFLSRFINKIKLIKKVTDIFNGANTYRIIEKNQPKNQYISKLKYNIKIMYGEYYKERLKNSYTKLVKAELNKKNISQDDCYILVALHYQPEETSCPTGGMFVEQRQIIKLLSQTLPKHIKIYVKEHSSQFHPNMEGEAGRSICYYKDILNISSNIVFIDANSDTFELIDNSLAIVTISGTIGWESAFRGKPTFIFGRAWYEDMPGIFKIKSSEDLKNAYETITSKNYVISNNELINYHSVLSKYLISSAHYKATKNKNITSINDSANNLYQGIARYLKDEIGLI